MKRTIMVSLAVLFGIMILGILLLPVLLDVTRYRDRYLPVLERALQRRVEVQDVRVTLFPRLGIRLRDIVIADDPSFSASPFVTIPSAVVEVQWKPLLHRRIQVERVLLKNPTMRMVRNQTGTWNTATLGTDRSLQGTADEPSKKEDVAGSLLGLLTVKQLDMAGGTLRYEDQSPHKPLRSCRIENLTVATNSVQIGQTATLHLQGLVLPSRLSLEMNGKFGPLQPNFDISAIDMKGRIGRVEVTAQGKAMDGNLDLDVRIPHMTTEDVPAELTLPRPVALNHIHAHLMVPLFHDEPSALSSSITIDPLTLDLQSGGSVMHVSGKGTAGRLEMMGEASLIDSQDFFPPLSSQRSIVLEHVRFRTVIQEDQIDLVSLKANAFTGMLEAHGTWDRHSPIPLMLLQGHFTHFALEPLFRAVHSSSLRVTGTGDLHWNVEGAWPWSEHSKMKGPVRLEIKNGQLIGVDVMQALEEALQLSDNQAQSTDITKFTAIHMKGNLEHSALVISHMVLEASDFILKGTGTMGFDRSLQLRGTFGLPPALGDQIIQQYPLATIVRQQGLLMVPFVVKGTIQQPELQLDMQSLGEQVQKNVERRIEKALQGDEQELQHLLQDGEKLLKQLFGQ